MLYIYSGEVPELNAMLDRQLGSRHTLTTIPATTSDMASAKHVTQYFRQAGFRARLQSARFYRDRKCLQQIIKNSDAVYLMGGNTFEFLAYAARVGLFEMLRDFEASGGVILGESAGSILLTCNIATALIPTTDPDDHTLELDSYAGMGRIPFHISPHFEHDAKVAERELNELQALAHVSKIPVRVLEDGEGFIMKANEIIHNVGPVRELLPEHAPSPALDTGTLLPTWAMQVS